MPIRYSVVRTDDDSKEWVWGEIQEGRLRQGWGRSNMQLPLGEDTSEKMAEWCKRFRQQGQELWHEEISEEQAKKRYTILRRMVEIQREDIIIIPKMPTWGVFSVARATGTYRFDTDKRSKPEDDDYRHIVPIEVLKQVSHRANTDAQQVATSLRAYQTAVNVVCSRPIIDSIQRLLKAKDTSIPHTIPDIMIPLARDSFAVFAEDWMTKLTLQPLAFEELIETMISRGGYRIVKKRHFNRKGGDVDIVAEPSLPPLADAFEQRAPLLLQIKKKSGIDTDDTKGVNQLVEMSETYPGATMVLISSAERFTDACKVLAQEHRVQLIPRGVLARLLLKYML